MRYVIFVLIVLLSLGFTCGVFAAAPVAGGGIPDLLTAFIVAIALADGSWAVLVMASVYGVILDALFSQAIGIFAIPYLIVAFVIMLFARRIRARGYVLFPLILGFLAFMGKEVLVMGLSMLFGSGVGFRYIFVHYTLPAALVTAGLSPLFYLLFRKVFQMKLVRAVRVNDLKDIGRRKTPPPIL